MRDLREGAMDHRIWACSISDLAQSWKEETKRDHKFEILHAIYDGALKVVDPFLDYEVLDTDNDVKEFLARNKQYGISYFASGHEVIMKSSHFMAISEVIRYGGPKTVEDLDLIMALQHLCVSKDEFRRWIEKTGKPLPKFWFADDNHDASSSGSSADQSSLTATRDVSADVSKRERESLQKQIAALALVLAEKSAKYKNGDKPNANQIAEAVALMLDAIPEANKHGVSSTSLRASIKAGIEMLQGKRGTDE
jgi:hypothetical protein